MLVINDEQFIRRAEIVWEKGTNRAEFFRGEVNKYGWMDIGSSFLPSDIIAAFLYAQLEHLDEIQEKRKMLWTAYYQYLKELELEGRLILPYVPDYATNNAHMFYIILKDIETRSRIIDTLKKNEIYPVFHYLSLHKSPFYEGKHDGRPLPHSDRYADTLLRLPMYYELNDEQIRFISDEIKNCLR